jgi:hypothetical protein
MVLKNILLRDRFGMRCVNKRWKRCVDQSVTKLAMRLFVEEEFVEETEICIDLDETPGDDGIYLSDSIESICVDDRFNRLFTKVSTILSNFEHLQVLTIEPQSSKENFVKDTIFILRSTITRVVSERLRHIHFVADCAFIPLLFSRELKFSRRIKSMHLCDEADVSGIIKSDQVKKLLYKTKHIECLKLTLGHRQMSEFLTALCDSVHLDRLREIDFEFNDKTSCLQTFEKFIARYSRQLKYVSIVAPLQYLCCALLCKNVTHLQITFTENLGRIRNKTIFHLFSNIALNCRQIKLLKVVASAYKTGSFFQVVRPLSMCSGSINELQFHFNVQTESAVITFEALKFLNIKRLTLSILAESVKMHNIGECFPFLENFVFFVENEKSFPSMYGFPNLKTLVLQAKNHRSIYEKSQPQIICLLLSCPKLGSFTFKAEKPNSLLFETIAMVAMNLPRGDLTIHFVARRRGEAKMLRARLLPLVTSIPQNVNVFTIYDGVHKRVVSSQLEG